VPCDGNLEAKLNLSGQIMIYESDIEQDHDVLLSSAEAAAMGLFQVPEPDVRKFSA
jgi:hypothetical protein